MTELYPGESFAESSRAPKVSQIDADELDEALVQMLSEKVSRSLSNFRTSISWDLKPEIELAIKLVIFRYGILDPSVRSSPGAKLQNLKLANKPRYGLKSTRSVLLIYLLLHPPIFPSYLLKRIQQYALSKQWPDLPNQDWRKKAWNVLGRIELAAKVWEAAGWGCFLWDGKYPSLLTRILGLQLVPSQPHLTKLVSYEFMNRQLVWSAFTEFLIFAIPLLPTVPASLRLSTSTLITPFTHLFSQPTHIDYTSLPLIPPGVKKGSSSQNDVKSHQGPLAHLPKDTCPLCYLRHSTAPVRLSSNTQGSEFTLPPINGPSDIPFGHDDEENDDEENRVFMPTRSDCKGGCLWCYYCIGEELYKHQEVVKKKKNPSVSKMQNGDQEGEEGGWSCLRCGGWVRRARRVGAEAEL